MWEILGIKPTTDIKEIKSAYAKLAKQFNPEEHPEEFKRIFDAYKAASNYAKGRGRSISVELKTVEKLKQSRKEKEDSGLDFSAVGTDGKKAENDGENGEKLSFENVDLNGRKAVGNEESIPPEFKFAIDTHNELNMEKRRREAEEQSSEKFDFSSVNELYDDEAEEKQRAELRRSVLAVMKRIINDKGGYKQWADLFDWENFSAVKDDIEFRISAAGMLKDTVLSKDTAMLIADEFGMGSRVIILDYGRDRWGVHIIKGTEKKQKEKKKIHTLRDAFELLKNNAKTVFIVASVIILTVLPAVLDPDNVGGSGAENVPFPTKEVIESWGTVDFTLSDKSFEELAEMSFSEEQLYEFCKGKWTFDFGYIELKDDRTFEMEYYGEVYSGETNCRAPGKGARLMITFSAPDTEIDGTRADAGVFWNKEKVMIYQDSNGKIISGRPSE